MNDLSNLTVQGFVQALAGDAPAPGGGSVAALAGSLAAALCAMVARLTVGKKKYETAREAMEAVIPAADGLAARLLSLMDADTAAYNGVVAAFRLPKETDAQKSSRHLAIQAATREAARVPLATLKTVAEIVKLAESVVESGNPNCITDAGTAVQLIETAALAAAYNVRINVGALEDRDFADRCGTEVDATVSDIRRAAARLATLVDNALQ